MQKPRPILTQEQQLLKRCQAALVKHRRRARADGLSGLPYGLDDLLALVRSARTCSYCRAPVGWDCQLDHKQPTSRGGAHALGNLCVCCGRCNRLKGLLDAAEFALLLALLA